MLGGLLAVGKWEADKGEQSPNWGMPGPLFPPGEHDPRLALLSHHDQLLANARVLDVGCNEGWVSCEIGVFMHLSLLTIR